jgi:hypothetical protein
MLIWWRLLSLHIAVTYKPQLVYFPEGIELEFWMTFSFRKNVKNSRLGAENFLTLRGGRTIQDQEHVRHRLLSLEYKASKKA